MPQKRRFKKRTFKPKTLGKVQKRQVKKMIHGVAEKKYQDQAPTFVSNIVVPNTGTILDISNFNLIIPGDNQFQREGIKISPQNLNMRGSVAIPNLGDVTNNIRMIIFRWNEASSISVPSISDILYNNGSGTARLWSSYSKEAVGRYAILLDKTYSMSADGTRMYHFNYNFNKKHKSWVSNIVYNTTISNKYNYYMLLISDSAAAPHPVIDYETRLTFTDI